MENIAISQPIIRLGVSVWSQDTNEYWIGPEKITKKCDELKIPYILGENNDHIIISESDLPKLNIKSLSGNMSTVREYPSRYFKTEPVKDGKYLFVSDIHGYDKNLTDELKEIAKAKHLPQIIFFLGDIVGTKSLDGLQKKFYDVFNKVKASKDACIETNELIKHIYKISSKLTNDDIQKITDVASYEHFGHFVSNLPIDIRKTLHQDLVKNAQLVYESMKKFTRRGSLVVVIEGNWDARHPLDFKPGKRCIPTPSGKRDFFFKRFINRKRNSRIIFVDDHTSIETENIIFQTLSFDGVMNYNPGTFSPTKNGKKVILVSHVQAAWEAVKKNIPMTNEGQTVSKNIWNALCDLQPNSMIHGHLHEKLLNELGDECSGYKFPKFNYIECHYLSIRTTRFINFD